MWEIFELLCGKKGVTTADVCKALGIAQSTMSNWKKRRNRINVKHGQKIADYFGVSLQYLMTGMELSQEQALLYGEDADPVTANIKWYYANDDLKALIETVKNAPSDVLVRLRYYAEGLMAGRKD